MPEEQKPLPLPLPLQWNQLALDAIIYSRTSPPLAARALAMLHTALFDAWCVYSRCSISTTTARYIRRFMENCGDDEIQKTYSYAAYRVLTELFWPALPPEKRNLFRDLMYQYNFDPDDCSVDTVSAQGIGNLIAKLVTDHRRGDGSNQEGMLYHFPPWGDYTGYKPVNPPQPSPPKNINHWQPLLTGGKVQQFLTPHWGLVKPFALASARQFRPGEPFNSIDHPFEFRDQAAEVVHISACLTDREKVIAEYWSDGPGTYSPPGHWAEIAQFVAVKKKYNDSNCIKLFFALGNALLDASIACWDCKRIYDSARPVTVIRELYRGTTIRAWGGPGKGTVEMDGKDWMPYQPPDFVTPPFAEYVSGHSTFSRAAATILQYFTQSDNFCGCTVKKKGSSAIEPGITPAEDVTLDWATFTAAAEEAGMSRMYSGIHFKRANECGQKLGEAVGKRVWEKVQFYYND